MFCSSCGSPLDNADKFCKQCGRPADVSPTVTPAVSVVAPLQSPPPQPGTTNTFAIVSLICGFLSLFFPAAVVAVVFGHLSRSQIRRQGNVQKGAGMALAGLIMGYLGICFIPFLIIAAIAIPNLLRARIAANEASGVGSIRTINTAEVTYQSEYKKFACDLRSLGPASGVRDENQAGLIDSTLASGQKSGYRYRLECINDEEGKPSYTIIASPAARNQTGSRTFCSDATGVIRSSDSEEDCLTAAPLQ